MQQVKHLFLHGVYIPISQLLVVGILIHTERTSSLQTNYERKQGKKWIRSSLEVGKWDYPSAIVPSCSGNGEQFNRQRKLLAIPVVERLCQHYVFQFLCKEKNNQQWIKQLGQMSYCQGFPKTGSKEFCWSALRKHNRCLKSSWFQVTLPGRSQKKNSPEWEINLDLTCRSHSSARSKRDCSRHGSCFTPFNFSTTLWRSCIICVMSCAGCLLPCEYATINCRLERARRAGLPPFVCLGITCAMQKMAHSGSEACRTWNALPSDLIDAEWIPCGARKHGGCLFWQKLCPQMMTIHRRGCYRGIGPCVSERRCG